VWHNERLREKRCIPDVWIAAAIFAGNLLILGPYLATDFSGQPWNNGYIYTAIARMFRDHSWGWNPLQYGGAPFRYLYPPIFHVLIGAMPVASLGHAFHLVSGIGYALAPASLYVLALQLFRSRLAAAFAAVAYSVFPSPLYTFLPQWRNLALPYFHAPWGFVALAGYDEAAHTFALPLMFLAAAAAWRGRWRTAALAGAAVLLTNWPALIGLGFVIAAIAAARLRDLGPAKTFSAAFGLAGTAYGLAAFWMTPGYFISSTLLNRVVLRHTPVPAAPWTWVTALILLGAAGLIGLALRRCVPQALAMPLAWVALSGAVVVSFTLAGNALLPSANRYMLEFNAGAVLALAALVSLTPRRWRRVAFGAAAAAGFGLASGFLTHAWAVQPRAQDPRSGPAWQVADWLNRNNGTARVLASGELDSTLALWSDVPQAGGTGQDISNFLVFAAERQVAFGCGPGADRIAQLWLRALNVKHLVVHGAASREYFHWYAQPERFRAMPVAWDNGAGDTIYRVPDSGKSDAVVVDITALGRLPRLRSTGDVAFLEAYVAWASGKRPAAIRWIGADAAEIDAALAPGEAILVKSNWDAGWRVSGASVGADPIGFLLIRSGPGRQRLALRFGAAWDVWLGRAITLLTIVLLWAGVRGARIAAAAVVPAVVAYGVLLWSAPATVAVAEDAFARVAPPLISPRGIVNGGGTVAIWGLNFGGPGDTLRVFVGGREAEIVHRGVNVIDIKPPDGLPANADVSVEVNGCRGNAFTMPAR
jgi:hypothetical protein